MAVTHDKLRANGAHFVIKPNSSLSWRGNQLFLVVISAVSFSIAGLFAAQGMWLVLPCAGLEMLVLAIVLHRCCVHSRRQEVVSILGRRVRVAVGTDKPERWCTFDRSWARVILAQAKTKGYPSKLLIRAHGREVEIGACLIDEERQQLAEALRAAL